MLMVYEKFAEDQISDTVGKGFIFSLDISHELRTEKYFNKFIGQLVVAQL
jgi:hypothetical protein